MASKRRSFISLQNVLLLQFIVVKVQKISNSAIYRAFFRSFESNGE